MSHRYPTGYERQSLLRTARSVVRWDARTGEGAPRWLVQWLVRSVEALEDPGGIEPVYVASLIIAAYESRGESASRSSIDRLRGAVARYPAAGPWLGKRVRVRKLAPGTWAARVMGETGRVVSHEPPFLIAQAESGDEPSWWLHETQVDLLDEVCTRRESW